MSERHLAAITFEGGDEIDELLLQVAQRQCQLGKRVIGALQSRGQSTGECHCSDMDLVTIGSNEDFRISQPLGVGSNGCRLNPGALAECSAFLEKELFVGCDLLILNRFGKGESEGRGFRDLISTAFSLQVPVLTASRSTYLKAWREFCGDFGCELAFDVMQVEDWLSSNRLTENAA